MRIDDMIRRALPFLAVVLSGVSAFATNGTWVAREGVGTGGTNWTEWNDTDNWVDGIVASNSDSTATLTPAAGKYISLPDALSLKKLASETSSPAVVLRGDGMLTLNMVDLYDGPKNCCLYTPLTFSVSAETTYTGPQAGCQLCGPVVSKISGGGTPRFSGTVSFRYDFFATEAGEVRSVSAWKGGIKADNGAKLRFIAPHGSSTNLTSRWVQTAGSAFLKQADGETPHVLSAGTMVTGDGIPADTFLKRVFPDGSIELSAAPTTTAAATALTFAAFNSKTLVTLPDSISAFNVAGTRNIYAQKYRAEDDFTLKMASLSLNLVGTNKDLNHFAFKTETGYLPGRIVISSTCGTASAPCCIVLENCHLEIAADNTYYNNTQASIDNASHTARITVTNNLTRKFAKMTKIAGTLVKDGAGTLSMHMPSDTAANLTGSIVVEEGTFAPLFPDAGTNSIPSLTVRSGARFVVPEGVVLCVGSLVVEEGSILGGEGRIVCAPIPDSTVLGLVLEDGVSIDDGRSGEDFSIEVLRGAPDIAAQDGDRVWIFGTNALLRVNGAGVFDVLVVGGGGGGGCKAGGGGGGGGVVYTQQMVVANGIYSLTVGRGGIGSPNNSTRPTNGGDSMVFGLLAYGGGAGGTYSLHNTGYTGASGGGGGIWYPYSSNSKCKGGDGIDGQGYAGGIGFNTNMTVTAYRYCSGGGGGGAGAPGVNAGMEVVNGTEYASGGNGGDGMLCEIFGSWYYGGGGGGGTTTTTLADSHRGGLGGGGDGGVTSSKLVVSPGKNGQDGFGGGGGGGSVQQADSAGGAGGNGGSGVVILRWSQSMPVDLPDGDVAVGGSVRCRKGYAVHTFTNNGTFALSEPMLVDVLLVGGGGGGGFISGGGGGGGGVIAATNVYLVAGSYDVTVGAGGSGATSSENSAGSNGGDSSFAGFRAVGGGGGGGYSSIVTTTLGAGKTGGSGGGGGAPLYNYVEPTHPGGLGTGGQGFPGGMGVHRYDGTSGPWQSCQGGGGGGAGEPGGNATTNVPGVSATAPGKGGDGVVCDFSGAEVYYGGGGGGGSSSYTSTAEHYKAAGGKGGGGHGGSAYYIAPSVHVAPGENGVDGLGGGGGGPGGYVTSSATPGRGGSGIVIIRYRVRPKGMVLLFL